jgi:hypothetical protein
LRQGMHATEAARDSQRATTIRSRGGAMIAMKQSRPTRHHAIGIAKDVALV